MLKKLSKYGNSTTLVIDKAILELLNMNDSTIVKLHTDGKSLIITPVENSSESKRIYYDWREALKIARDSMEKKNKNKEPDAKTLALLQEEFAQLFKKHHDLLNKFNAEILSSKEFQEAANFLSEKYDPVNKSDEYLKAFNKLEVEFCPEMAEFQKEMEAISLPIDQNK